MRFFNRAVWRSATADERTFAARRSSDQADDGGAPRLPGTKATRSRQASDGNEPNFRREYICHHWSRAFNQCGLQGVANLGFVILPRRSERQTQTQLKRLQRRLSAP